MPKQLFTPVCVQGGVHLDPTIFKYFHIWISVPNLHPLCIHLRQPWIIRSDSEIWSRSMNTFTQILKKKKLICLKIAANNDLMLSMLISVIMVAHLMSFFHQKMSNWYLGNYKKGVKGNAKWTDVGSKWTPLVHLSANIYNNLSWYFLMTNSA